MVRQFAGPFFLSTTGFILIGMIDIVFTLVDLIINSGVSALVVFRLLIYKIPAVMILFFPMACLFSSMVVVIRMIKDNEITILRAAGIGWIRIIWPIVIIATGVSLIAILANDKLVPWTNHISEALIRQSVHTSIPPTISSQLFFKDNQNRCYYVASIDQTTQVMHDIIIAQLGPTFPTMMTAKTATRKGSTWILANGTTYHYFSSGLIQSMSKFSTMSIDIDPRIFSETRSDKTPFEMDSAELASQIAMLSHSGLSTRHLEVEYHIKSSLPSACFAFSILGLAVCMGFIKSHKDWWGVIAAVCTATLSTGFYFFLMAVSRSLAGSGTVNWLTPLWGAWLPNIVFILIGGTAIIAFGEIR